MCRCVITLSGLVTYFLLRGCFPCLLTQFAGVYAKRKT